MNQRSNPQNETRRATPFRPNLRNCVAGDLRLARAAEESYSRALEATASYTYASLLTAECMPALSHLQEDFAREEVEHFRLLGELILALGGNPTLRCALRISAPDASSARHGSIERGIQQLVCEEIRSEKLCSERLETLMGHTEDRVVRSLLAYLISDSRRHIELLCQMLDEKMP